MFISHLILFISANEFEKHLFVQGMSLIWTVLKIFVKYFYLYIIIHDEILRGFIAR